MCVSLHPARFSDTTTGTFEKNGRRYLAYQNVAQNLQRGTTAGSTTSSPTPRRRGSNVRSRSGNWSFEEAVTPQPSKNSSGSGNAMILPIPDDVNNIEIIDTTSCPNFLKDIRSALTPRTRGGLRRGGPIAKGADSVRIIEFDVFTIVIAENAKAIGKALKSKAVPDDRRPAINQKIFDAYAKWYPGWSISVWCFNNTDAKRAKPVLIGYEPTKQDDPDLFFVPTLDAHDGDVPKLDAEVDVDHTIFVACEGMSGGATVFYSDRDIAAGIAELLPEKVLGKVVSGQYRNGDVVFRRSDLKRGVVRGLRALPPGAPKSDEKVFI